MEFPAALVLARRATTSHLRSALPDAPTLSPARRDLSRIHRLRSRTSSLLTRVADVVAPTEPVAARRSTSACSAAT